MIVCRQACSDESKGGIECVWDKSIASTEGIRLRVPAGVAISTGNCELSLDCVRLDAGLVDVRAFRNYFVHASQCEFISE